MKLNPDQACVFPKITISAADTVWRSIENPREGKNGERES